MPHSSLMNTMRLASISTDQVSDSRRWDIHPFLPDDIPDNLAKSFREIGILSPPVVYESSGGKYEIIHGKRRLLATGELLHLPECPCFVLPQSTDPKKLLSVLFESHRISSPLSPMEIAYFCKISLNYLTPAEITETFLAGISGKSSVSMVKKYGQLAGLETGIQQFVHTLFISESMAHDLLKISQEDRSKITQIFNDFQMGGGKQRRLFMLLRDLCHLRNISFSIFLEKPEIAGILNHREMNNPQKLQSLFTLLQQLSTPTYSADEDSFKSQITKLKLPVFCSVQHTPAFETNEISLTIRFSEMEQFAGTWPALSDVLQRLHQTE
jgi:hypothetical protein